MLIRKIIAALSVAGFGFSACCVDSSVWFLIPTLACGLGFYFAVKGHEEDF